MFTFFGTHTLAHASHMAAGGKTQVAFFVLDTKVIQFDALRSSFEQEKSSNMTSSIEENVSEKSHKNEVETSSSSSSPDKWNENVINSLLLITERRLESKLKSVSIRRDSLLRKTNIKHEQEEKSL